MHLGLTVVLDFVWDWLRRIYAVEYQIIKILVGLVPLVYAMFGRRGTYLRCGKHDHSKCPTVPILSLIFHGTTPRKTLLQKKPKRKDEMHTCTKTKSHISNNDTTNHLSTRLRTSQYLTSKKLQRRCWRVLQ